tara:strand:- start:1359 stop:2921 length:1563 start_codon:yes stop_codon:yes gene_type:complete
MFLLSFIMIETISNKHIKIHQTLEEQFFTVFFNINRVDISNYHNKFECINNFLTTIHSFHLKSKYSNICNYFLNYFIKLIAYTRDIYYGCGEKTFSYLLIVSLHLYFPNYTFSILDSFLNIQNSRCSSNADLPFGSCCDIKYFSLFLNSTHIIDQKKKNQIFDIIVKLVNDRLFKDLINVKYVQGSHYSRYFVSNISKWIPREKSKKLNFLYLKLASHWSINYDNSVNIHFLKKYRLLLSQLNSILLTFETHSNPVVPCTFKQQLKHYIYCNHPYYSNFQHFFSSNSNFSPVIFINHMIKAIQSKDNIYRQFIDFKWHQFISQFDFKIKCIPIVDLSFYSNQDFYNFDNSIAISCFLSHFNTLGRKILVASDKPIWIDLNQFPLLSDQIIYILNITNSINSFTFNLNNTLQFIDNSFVCTNTTNDDIKDLHIILFITNPTNFPSNLSFSKSFQPSILLWNLSNYCFDFKFINSIQYDFKFINSTSINYFFKHFLDVSFKHSNFSNYFGFLNHHRYHLLSI